VSRFSAIAGGVLLGAARAPRETLPVSWTRADGALLQRVLVESRVDRVPTGPRWSSYLEAWAEALTRWLDRLLGRHPGMLAGVVKGVEVLTWILAGAAFFLVGYWLVRWTTRRSVSRTSAAVPQVRERSAETSPVWTPQQWRQDLERRLASRDVVGALSALWWWLARSVVGPEVDESWTSQQVLTASRRHDLTAEVRQLDRMIYGASRPAMEEVRALFGQFARSVA
jgi:hypothetical protein